jgi:hypothetical protein
MNAHSLFAAMAASRPLAPDRSGIGEESNYRDRADCERLLMACYSLMDRGHHEAAAELFAEDATWVRDEGPVRSRDGILAALHRRSPQRLSRHVITNVVVTPMGDYAEATACMLALRGTRVRKGPAPLPDAVAVCDLLARFRRNEDWEITHLEPVQVFMPPPAD